MEDSLDLSIAQYNFDKKDIENMKAMLFLLTNGDFETVSYVIRNNVDNSPVTIERMILLSLDVLNAVEFLQNKKSSATPPPAKAAKDLEMLIWRYHEK